MPGNTKPGLFVNEETNSVIAMVRDVVDENRCLKFKLGEMTEITRDLEAMLLEEFHKNELLREELGLANADEQKEHLTNHVKVLQAENEDLRHVVRHREATINTFSRLLAERRYNPAETSQLKGENSELKDKVAELQTKNDNMLNELSQIPELMSELESLRLKISELMNKNEILTGNLERARSDLEMAKKQRKELEPPEDSRFSSLRISRINDLIRENGNLYYDVGFIKSEQGLKRSSNSK